MLLPSPPKMLSVVVCLFLGLVLVAAAGLKLAGGARARAALATYGLRDGRLARLVWGALIATELVLGVAVGAGSTLAANAAALLMAGAATAQIAAILSGRTGAPCACFGAKGKVGKASAGRAIALAAAFALAPILPRTEPSTDEWLAIGVAGALTGLIVLGIVVLALAREIGMLRLAVPQAGALELSHEGPEIGAQSPLAEHFDLAPNRIGLAVFTSEGCGLCRVLAPTVERFGAHPSVVLRTFDEVEHAAQWSAADVPGSPFAVALAADGTVLAKGTFNSGAQLESVLAAAERRRGAVRA
jgi:hypothetical protein